MGQLCFRGASWTLILPLTLFVRGPVTRGEVALLKAGLTLMRVIS